MMWWGYAGFSGAISACVAILAAIVGLSAEIVLNLAAYTAGGFLAVGAVVYLCVLLLRATARSAKHAIVAPRVEPAFLRPAGAQVQAAAHPIDKPTARGPGAIDMLFPQQAAQ